MIEYRKYNVNGIEFELTPYKMKTGEAAQMTPYSIRMSYHNLNEVATSVGLTNRLYFGQSDVIQRMGELISEVIPFYQKSLFIESEIDDFGETWRMVIRNDFLES